MPQERPRNPYSRQLDNSDTSHSRKLDISTTNYCRQKDESTTNHIQMAQYILNMELEANTELRREDEYKDFVLG